MPGWDAGLLASGILNGLAGANYWWIEGPEYAALGTKAGVRLACRFLGLGGLISSMGALEVYAARPKASRDLRVGAASMVLFGDVFFIARVLWAVYWRGYEGAQEGDAAYGWLGAAICVAEALAVLPALLRRPKRKGN
eukprot:tig00001130_g7243.t1